MIESLFHEQYESDGRLVLFRCEECGYVSLSLGSLHGHIEGHESFLSYASRMLPIVGKSFTEPLMDRTEIVRVDSETEIDRSDVEGL